MAKVRVLVVDDSALMRKLLTAILSKDPMIEVVGAVADPILAQSAIGKLTPAVLTLDVEMPRMDGITFLERLMRVRPTPVVMVSSLTERGSELTLRALELGAFDFVTKPKLDMERGTVELASELVAKVKAAARGRLRAPRTAQPARAAVTAPPTAFRTTHGLVAIGASTGGTEALREVLTALPADSPPIVIVQHMPPVFTRQFADRLNGLCKVRVREASDGDLLLPGHVLIAPGGESHLEIVRSGARFHARLLSAPPVHHHRPSVDVLFESCARQAGANAVGVILTGMGDDGARGMLAMRHAGARTIAQDEATSIVFGMPKEAIARGGAEAVAPLERVAGLLLKFSREPRSEAARNGSRSLPPRGAP